MLKKYCQIFQPRLLPLYTGLSGFYLPTVSRMHMCILSPCSILPYHKQQKHNFFDDFHHIEFHKSKKLCFDDLLISCYGTVSKNAFFDDFIISYWVI